MATPVPEVTRVACPLCKGEVVPCSLCGSTGVVLRSPYRPGGGEQGDDFRDMSPALPQPAPRPGRLPHSVDLVVADLWERKVHGIAKYGVAHQADNGRDHLVDLYQELLDACVYVRAEIERRRGGSPE